MIPMVMVIKNEGGMSSKKFRSLASAYVKLLEKKHNIAILNQQIIIYEGCAQIDYWISEEDK